MISVLKTFGKSISKTDHVGRQLNNEFADLVIWPNRRWPRMGVILEHEALVLDYRTFMSFRVKSGNLGFSKDLQFFRYAGQIDRPYLSEYFRENCDNPYALYHVMQSVHFSRPIKELTQFPPLSVAQLSLEKRRAAVERLIKNADVGDTVFSSSVGDSISSLIRREDRGQFSHCASYVGNGEMVDAGPNGVEVNSVHDYPTTTRLALYRLRQPLSNEQKENIAAFARKQAEDRCRYNYWGVIKLYLHRKIKLPIPRSVPSVNELLYSNEFKLVDFI